MSARLDLSYKYGVGVQALVQNKRWMMALALVSVVALVACGDDEGGEGGNNASPNNASNNVVNNNNNAENNNNNSDVVRETIFPIGYVLRNRAEIPGVDQGGDYIIIASDGSQMVKVNPEGISCHFGCQLSDNLNWFIWSEANGLETDLKIAPVTGIDYNGVTIDMGQEEVVATDVQGFHLGGDTISYVDSDFKIVAGAMPGDNAAEIATVGSVNGTQGGFYLKPDGTSLITWTVTLESMTLSRHDLGTNDVDLEFYVFESTGFGGTGSFYTSSERMSWSPDGKYLATVSTALVDTTRCARTEECMGVDERCGNNGRCTSQRLNINMINMEETSKLSTSCTSDGDCGEAHTCDFADPADPNSGRCLPGRLDLGPAGPLRCSSLSAGEFTDVRDHLSWSPDSKSLYVLASEDCDNYNVPRTAILQLTPALGTPTVITENPGVDFAVGNCYDVDEEEFVVEDEKCVIEIEQMSLSPSGQTFVFAGTAPAASSANRYELFTIDRKGERSRKWFQNDDIFTNVERVQALKDF